MTSALLLGAALLATPLQPPAAASDEQATCIRIEDVTLFQPRGEIYVRLSADCQPKDFEEGRSITAHVEVLVSALPPVSEDMRVRPEAPKARATLVFDGLALQSGESVLVRLVRFGRIVDLRSLQVP